MDMGELPLPSFALLYSSLLFPYHPSPPTYTYIRAQATTNNEARTYIIFSCFCFSMGIFVWFFIPETKGMHYFLLLPFLPLLCIDLT
jgi:hypothetical protein